MSRRIKAAALERMLGDGEELALLDVREEGAFARGHILFASSLPLSRLELGILDLVPRPSVRMVLCDAGEGLAERAAGRLAALGYTDVSVLDGGADAWRAAGRELFRGVNVPSKAFGEFVERTLKTPSISARELKAKLETGDDVIVLDSRPIEEYRAMSVPGAIAVPGAELVYRIHDLVPAPETLVVVNCAGRTRSIIGAQSLINAGIENPVAALRNGTMGWHLARFELESGMDRRAPEVSREGLGRARAAAARVARRAGVRTIDRTTFARWRAESDRRSLYVFDVRGPEEFEAGHLPGSASAPGGQLVQRTDATIGTRGARVVLVDDTAVRATMTASWLTQMGWENVAVLGDGLAGAALETGPRPARVAGLDGLRVDEISAAGLAAALGHGTHRGAAVVVVDLATSRCYRAGHVPGAWFAVRSRMHAGFERLPKADLLVLTSEDGVLARLAVPEAQRLTDTPVRALRGGTAAWRAAGLALADGLENPADKCDDVYLRPYQEDSGVEDAMRAYLKWEVDLVDQIERDGGAPFRIVTP